MYQSPVLVEEFIDGREFYVGVLGNAHARALPVIELDFTGFPPHLPKIASFEAKWSGGEAEGGDAGAASIRSTRARSRSSRRDSTRSW